MLCSGCVATCEGMDRWGTEEARILGCVRKFLRSVGRRIRFLVIGIKKFRLGTTELVLVFRARASPYASGNGSPNCVSGISQQLSKSRYICWSSIDNRGRISDSA
ncbi:hypothetical protein OROGR_011146 [Orobanche gracilis]